MKIDEALYQLKQNIKMHEIEGTTSNQNEREKALLDYITNLQEKYERMKENAKILSNGYNDLEKRHEKAINEVIRVLQIILEQPSEDKLDDLWIINKLEGIQTLLQGEDKE